MKKHLASKLFPYLAAGAVLAAAPSAMAGIPCPGNVNFVQLGNDGTVAVNVTGSGTTLEFQVCNTNTTS